MNDDVLPVVSALTDEFFALGMMIDLMMSKTTDPDELLRKCAGSVESCRDLLAQLHMAALARGRPVRMH